MRPVGAVVWSEEKGYNINKFRQSVGLILG